MIPKVINYCWFGNNPKTPLIEKCIESWKKFCPNYEIIEWNESNFDINYCLYTQEAYDAKKFAFVSDVARLYAVYTNGGIYLDTDVELLKPLDEFLQYDGYLCWETERFLNTGLGFGAQKENLVIKELLEDYKNKKFYENDGNMNLTACTKLNTLKLIEFMPNIKRNGTLHIVNNFALIPPHIHKKVSVHHTEASWVENNYEDKKIKNIEYKDTILKKVLRSSIIFSFLDKYFSNKVVDIYTILVYDLIEYGVIHFIKRKFCK